MLIRILEAGMIITYLSCNVFFGFLPPRSCFFPGGTVFLGFAPGEIQYESSSGTVRKR